jgi:hypothetical protein
MSLETYLSALRDLATLPQPTRQGINVQREGRGDALSPDQLGSIEMKIAEFEGFTKEQPAETLADRSVLTFAGLADIRVGARLLALAESVEASGSIDPQTVGRESVPDVVSTDSEIEAIVGAIQRAANYEQPKASQLTEQKNPAQVNLSALQKDIQAEVDAILTKGDAAVKDLVGAVAWSSVGGTVGKIISEAVDRTAILKKAQELLSRLKRLALYAIEAGLRALDKALGLGSLKKFLDASGQKLSDWIDKGGVGNVLGALLDAGSVAPKCVEIVRTSGATNPQQSAAREAATKVSAHAQDLANISDKATDVLRWFPKAVWSSPVGPYLAAAIVVAIAAVAWQVQDHLDTTKPFALPNVSGGMISAVTSAVAKA